MDSRHPGRVFAAGAGVGTLGGLIGLGGAEFRLPLLIGVFGFEALPAVVLNKATSLAVVAASLPLRMRHVPLAAVVARVDVVATLLAGSLAGAWVGATWATRLGSAALRRVLATLLVGIALALFFGHGVESHPEPFLVGAPLLGLGMVSGFGIGVVAALMGVAGGELLIPTIVLLFGVDVKLAGSLSLAVSLPTMLVAFSRYSRDASFEVLRAQRRFVGVMVLGSVVGAAVGSRLLGVVPSSVLLPSLASVLLLSAAKLWRRDAPQRDSMRS